MNLFLLLVITVSLQAQNPFITTWNTNYYLSSCNSCITIPTTGGGYNYDVDWNNDGTYDEFGITGNITHDYGTQGFYQVAIKGNFPRIYFNGEVDAAKITSIDQWGSIAWSSMENAFYGCNNLGYTATDSPNLTTVTSLKNMFRLSSFNGNISSWNVFNITNMESMFQQAAAFNQPIGSWNTANVTNMRSMFMGNWLFNQPIGTWNTSSVTRMDSLFAGCSAFNQPIGNWNTVNVTNMSYMFEQDTVFNQPIGNWNTVNVTNMSFMFSLAKSFNQPIGNWNTLNVVNMERMFQSATSFNQPIGNWNTSNVSNMAGLFIGTTSFNQPIGIWSTTNVTNMSGMFAVSSYNQPLVNWNTSNVTDMSGMFSGSSSFNQPIGSWNTANVTNMFYMFAQNSAFNQPIGSWNTTNVTNMSYMFAQNSGFNQPIGNWNVANVTEMYEMFKDAASFNQPLAGWNPSKVYLMHNMFSNASSFNQNLGSWKLRNVGSYVQMNGMLDTCGMDCNNYSATLIGWRNNNPSVLNRQLGSKGMLYGTNAVTARSELMSAQNWYFDGDSPSGVSCSAPLPVALLAFTADATGTDNLLRWSTSSERNSIKFEIEHSRNSKDFETIGSTPARNNTNTTQQYSFLHEKVALGAHYYRLKQVDFDGNYTYSNVVVTYNTTKSSPLNLFPNPTTGIVNLEVNNLISGFLTIRDYLGKVVFMQEDSATLVDLSSLPTGIYMVELLAGDQLCVDRLVKL